MADEPIMGIDVSADMIDDHTFSSTMQPLLNSLFIYAARPTCIKPALEKLYNIEIRSGFLKNDASPSGLGYWFRNKVALIILVKKTSVFTY